MDILREFVFYFCMVLSFIIIARALMSWVSPNPYEQPMRFLLDVTEPILAPLRRIIPHLGMIDITPMIAIIILQLVGNYVHSLG